MSVDADNVFGSRTHIIVAVYGLVVGAGYGINKPAYSEYARGSPVAFVESYRIRSSSDIARIG